VQLGRLLHAKVNQMFMANQDSMRKGQYSPALDAQTQHCLQQLPWWQRGSVA
jgi:hypothetical protein